MSFGDYLTLGQSVEIEILERDKSKKIKVLASIIDIGDSSIVVRISDMLKNNGNITKGMNAQILVNNGRTNFKVSTKVIKEDDFPLIHLIPVKKEVVAQRRNFVRVKDCLPCTYKIFTREEHEERKRDYSDRIANNCGVRTLLSKQWYHEREDLNKNDDINRAMVQLLINIDRKLDVILNSLDSRGKNVKADKCAIIEDISGSGAKISCDEKLGIGEILGLEIVLPTFPIYPITVFGEVLRTKKNNVANDGRFGIVVKFITINEDDRDTLIRYIFQKQREILRSARDSDY